MTFLLAVDTASTTFAVALARDGVVVSCAQHEEPQEHSRALLASIDEVCSVGGGRPDRLAIVVGPGSYAGLRVGIATVQGLAIAGSIPVAAVGTLEAVAAGSGFLSLTAIHPAGRGEYAAQDFSDGVAVSSVRLVSLTELEGAKVAGEEATAVGGLEVTPLERCHAAVRVATRRDPVEADRLDAIYVREPNITRPRRGAVGQVRE